MVVLSSVAGVRVRRANYVYGASKAGLDAFAQGMAEALRGSGASLMIVRPGWVATRMTEGRDPAPFATTPDAVAADVVAGHGALGARGVVAGARCGSCSPSCACCPPRCGAGSRAEPAAGRRPRRRAVRTPSGADVEAHVVDDRLGHGRGHRRLRNRARSVGAIPATWVRRHTVSR